MRVRHSSVEKNITRPSMTNSLHVPLPCLPERLCRVCMCGYEDVPRRPRVRSRHRQDTWRLQTKPPRTIPTHGHLRKPAPAQTTSVLFIALFTSYDDRISVSIWERECTARQLSDDMTMLAN